MGNVHRTARASSASRARPRSCCAGRPLARRRGRAAADGRAARRAVAVDDRIARARTCACSGLPSRKRDDSEPDYRGSDLGRPRRPHRSDSARRGRRHARLPGGRASAPSSSPATTRDRRGDLPRAGSRRPGRPRCFDASRRRRRCGPTALPAAGRARSTSSPGCRRPTSFGSCARCRPPATSWR